MSEAKAKAFDWLHQSLATEGGERNLIGLQKVEKEKQETRRLG